MRPTAANLSQTPRRLGLFNVLKLLTYGPGCVSRTLCSILFIVAVLAGLRDYWIEKTAFRKALIVKGVVTESDYTAWSFGEQEQLIVSFRYDINGQPFEGYSYTLSGGWREGREVEVEVNPSDPSMARIAGLDYAKFHFLVYAPAILALLLVIPAILGTIRTYRWGRLLERGAVAEAELLDAESLKGKKHLDIKQLRFQFTDSSGTTHEVKPGFLAKLKTQGPKLLFYNPKKPQRFLFLDRLFKMRLAAPGRWAPPENKRQTIAWFGLWFGPLLWAFYLIVKLAL